MAAAPLGQLGLPGMLQGPPGSAGPLGGPPSQGQPGVPINPQAPPGQAAQEAAKVDNISKVKSLVWPLKESLAACMRVAASNIMFNASVDAGIRGGDQQPMRFDKCLEDFYAICDQIEQNLKVALDCSNIVSSSQRYTPFSVVANKLEVPNAPEAHSYGQLISIVKTQVSHAKEIHDSLTDAARSINNTE